MPQAVAIKLDEADHKRLKNLGALRERSPHWLMKKAVQEFLEREERFERERLEDDQRWQRYLESGIAHENQAVIQWLDAVE